MTFFEALTLLLASIAVLVSLYTLHEQRKLQKEANDLQRSNAELAKRQMQQLEAQEAESKIARLDVDFVHDGKNHRIRISNIGCCDAHDIDISFDIKDPLQDPIIPSEYQSKFPIRRLPRYASVTMLASVHLNSPTSFDGTLSWSNPDGSPMEEQFCAYVEA